MNDTLEVMRTLLKRAKIVTYSIKLTLNARLFKGQFKNVFRLKLIVVKIILKIIVCFKYGLPLKHRLLPIEKTELESKK